MQMKTRQGAPRAGRTAPAKLSLAARTARDLGIFIVSGRYQPGYTLANEVEASARLGISRTAYREAIRTLLAKGLVTSRPKTGTIVNPRSSWNLLDPDILEWIFEDRPDPRLVLSLFELRQMIEPAAAALAAERRSSSHLARMGHALEEMALYGFETERGQGADRIFHEVLLEAAGNDLLMPMAQMISTAVGATTRFKSRKSVISDRDPLPEHQHLFDAVVARDPVRAKAAATAVIELALEDLKRGLGNDDRS